MSEEHTPPAGPKADYHLPRRLYRIDLKDPYEVRYWTLLFKISEAELRLAVQHAGHLRSNVEDYLGI